jgi:hypothetical protein
MNAGESQDITGLLRAWSQGNQAALTKLIPLVETELRRIAARYLRRGRPDPCLQTTALINPTFAISSCGWG